MNLNWKTFLLQQNVLSDDKRNVPAIDESAIAEKTMYALDRFAILVVGGKDAATLLQGQITCNVNDISEAKSCLAAICNPKGRVIATFLLAKKGNDFLLILPTDLVETVKMRLQMYVLRSQVQLVDASDDFCLLGLCEPGQSNAGFHTKISDDSVEINFPGVCKRTLIITNTENSVQLWSEKVDLQHFRKAVSAEWSYLDMVAGLPWVTKASSEEFIPQMLNLDKLGGISFNKGCYTGQEIIARTHYLGKVKREMFFAKCESASLPEANTDIIDKSSKNQDVVGKILCAQQTMQKCVMLVILQTAETHYDNLGLQNDEHSQIKLIPYAYD